MIYLLYGNEYYVMNREINNIIDKFNIDDKILIDFESNKISNIIEETMYIDLFNSRKLIVVSNFTFKKLDNNDEKLLIKYLDNKNDNVIIFKCIDDKLDERKTITKKFRNNSVIECKKLERSELNKYLSTLFKDDGYSIRYDLINKIINICGFSNYLENNNYLFNEINKLMLYKINDKNVTDDDIEKVISKNMENELFFLTNAMLKKDINGVFYELKTLKQLNVDPYMILSNISKQFRQLLQVKVLCDDMSDDEISNITGIKKYPVSLARDNCLVYSLNELVLVIEKIFDLDMKMKSLNIEPYKLLEEFCINFSK